PTGRGGSLQRRDDLVLTGRRYTCDDRDGLALAAAAVAPDADHSVVRRRWRARRRRRGPPPSRRTTDALGHLAATGRTGVLASAGGPINRGAGGPRPILVNRRRGGKAHRRAAAGPAGGSRGRSAARLGRTARAAAV